MLSTYVCSHLPLHLGYCVFPLECVCFVTYLYRLFSLMKKGVQLIACLCDHFVVHFNNLKVHMSTTCNYHDTLQLYLEEQMYGNTTSSSGGGFFVIFSSITTPQVERKQ